MTYRRNADGARFERVARIDQRIDTKTGEFEMVMASENEASDGHILRIAGISHAETIPLQLDHGFRAGDNLGTVANIRKGKRDGVPVLLGVGTIRTTGEGESLAARLDLVDAIARGDITGTSLTWEADGPGAVKERTSLPKGHPARVDPEEPNLRRRFGLLFEKSRAVEQSVVAIPADRAAVIGRGDGAEVAGVRALWHGLANGLELRAAREADPWTQALERHLADLEQRVRAAGAKPPRDHARPEPPVEELLSRVLAEVGDVGRRTRKELDEALRAAFGELTGVR